MSNFKGKVKAIKALQNL